MIEQVRLDRPLRDLVDELANGRRSCREMATAAFDRLDRVASLHGVAFRDDESVMTAAAELDRRFAASGPIGPLHGVTVSVKDWIETTPFPCAAGNPALSERRPTRDATVVERLRRAGALVVATSAIGPTSALHGTPQHPSDPSRSPGYSSAGEAVMVATGASSFGIGSDSGGSIRFPAHCCGLVGLRPTYGRVPTTGHFPRAGQLYDGRTVIGPLTRHVDDLRLIMPIIAGPDGRDPSCPPVPGSAEPASVEGLRVAVQRHTGGCVIDLGCLQALSDAVDALEAAGCVVVDAGADPMEVETSLDLTLRYWQRASLPVGEVDRLLVDWDRCRVRSMRLLRDVDAIISPAAVSVAPPLGVTGDADWTFLLAPSLWGWPAIVVPAGTGAGGLPVGVQVVGGPWDEGVCMALAELIESSRTIAAR